MKKISIPAQEMLEQSTHINIHTEALLKLYPDLQIHNNGKEVDYYAISINSECNEIQVTKENPSTYVFIHTAFPFKKVQLSCSRCDGLIRVNSNPSRVPLFLENEVNFRNEYILYSLIYEEVLKNNKFSAKTLSDIQLYILKFLQEQTKLNYKTDIYYLNNSIKNLLPFT